MSWHKKVLERTPDKTEWYMWDDDGNVALQTDWNLKEVVETAKASNNMFTRPSFTSKNGNEMHHVAFIPEAVQEWYARQHGVSLLSDPERMRHWANDSANASFRTRPGRL